MDPQVMLKRTVDRMRIAERKAEAAEEKVASAMARAEAAEAKIEAAEKKVAELRKGRKRQRRKWQASFVTIKSSLPK